MFRARIANAFHTLTTLHYRKRFWIYTAAIIACLGINLVTAPLTQPHIQQVTLKAEGSEASVPVTLPHRGEAQGDAHYIYTLAIQLKKDQSRTLHVFNKGCIVGMSTNGIWDSMESLDRPSRCGPESGLLIDLSYYLHPGLNEVALHIEPAGGIHGLEVLFPQSKQNQFYSVCPFALLLLLVLMDVLRHTGLDRVSRLMIGAAYLVYVFWLWKTEATEGQDIIFGHLPYIRHIAEHWTIPPPDGGWVFYHPPFYYALGAVLYNLGKMLGLEDPAPVVRLLSLTGFTGFVVISAFVLKRALTHKTAYYTALALLLFWPVGILRATRIDSDLLLYPFCAASFYFLLRWHQTREMKSLYLALIIGGFSLLVRTNGVLILLCIGAVVLWNLLMGHIRFKSLFTRQMLWISLLVLACGFANTGRTLYTNWTEGKSLGLVVGNQNSFIGNPAYAVANGLHEFLVFDYSDYLAQPYYNTPAKEVNPPGRALALNTLLKYMLVSETNFARTGGVMMISLLLLGILAYALLPLLTVDIPRLNTQLPFLALFAISMAGLLWNRYSVPIVCSLDFRYAHFSLIGLVALYGHQMQYAAAKGRKPLVWMGIGMVTLFIVLTLYVYTGAHVEGN